MSDNSEVLLVLECGALDADVLRTLPALAGKGKPAVRGMFIEDEDLLGAARLPGMSEISVTSLEVVSFDAQSIERDLSRHAQLVRNLFERAAERLHLTHSFEVTRGRAEEALARAAELSDWVVVCRALRSPGLRSRSGQHFRALLAQHSRLLFVNEPWGSGSRVVALADDASDRTRAALQRALAIAAQEQVEFVVALAGDGDAQALAEDVGCDRVERLQDLSEASVMALCEREDARMLVMTPTPDVDWQALLVRLLDKLSCSLLVIGR